MLAQAGWDTRTVLDALVTALAKGHSQTDLFDQVFTAAQRDDTLGDLAFAFEEVAADRRIKLLPPAGQAELFVEAARCSEFLGDSDGALSHVERAVAASPTHSVALTRLAVLLAQRGDRARLARLHVDAAAVETDADLRAERLRQALELVVDLEAPDAAIQLVERILKIEPGHAEARAEYERRLGQAGRHRDLARHFELALSREPRPAPEDAAPIQRRLLALYVGPVPEAPKALAQIEALLALDPADAVAVAAAETLLEHKMLGGRAAAALGDAYEKQGKVGNAAAMLTLELKLVRGPRQREVQRRLAILRQDALDDPQGAVELLGPLVTVDPADDDLRRRFVELSFQLDQPQEAAKLLTRALGASKDPAVRARVGADVGRVHLRAGDIKQAQAAFQQVVDNGQDEGAVLGAARELVEIFAEAGDVTGLVAALEHVVRREVDADQRHAAARRLARLSDTEGGDTARATVAWRALLDSPWADEALRRLEALAEARADHAILADVLEQRAERATDAAEARALGERAAVLRTDHLADRGAAIAAWLGLVARHGPSRELHARLLPLLEAERRFEELGTTLAAEVQLAPVGERVELLLKLAQVRQLRLADPAGALDALRAALAVAPDDRNVRAALERMLGAGSQRLEAAAVLEPLYRREGATVALVRLLETRGELGNAEVGLAALDEARRLAQDPLGDRDRALGLAARALGVAVRGGRWALPHWLGVVSELTSAVDPAVAAPALSAVLEGVALDDAALAPVAVAVADALGRAGEGAAAIELLRKALVLEAGSRDIIGRIDALLAEQGAPADREALYRAALAEQPAPARRRELLHSLARLQERELNQPAAAVATWQECLADDPRDAGAHSALVAHFESTRDLPALAAELRRALPLAELRRRPALALRLAEVELRRGEVAAALGLYEGLLSGAAELGGEAAAEALDDGVLATAEELAASAGRIPVLRAVLARRVELTSDAEQRAAISERLGDALAAGEPDREAAVAAYRVAAGQREGNAAVQRARRAARRVLQLEPGDAEMAGLAVELAAAEGDFAGVAAPFALLLAQDDRAATRALLRLEPDARDHNAVAAWAGLAAATLGDDRLDVGRRRALRVALARVLARDPDQLVKVPRVYRRLLDEAWETDVVEELRDFLATHALGDFLAADRRWLFEERARRAADPVPMLLEWAAWEEHELSDPGRAAEVYGRVLEREPDRIDALTEQARLRAQLGDPAGALQSLAALRERVAPGERLAVDQKVAALLLDQHRPAEALDVLEPALAAAPAESDTLRLVARALGFEGARPRAAQALEAAASAAEDPALRATVLEALLDLPHEGGLGDARARWFHGLLACREGDAEAGLEVALRAVAEHPAEEGFWDAAEKAARRLDRADPVAQAYARALDRSLDAETAEIVGRRVVDFHEEWFEDDGRVLELLRRVTTLAPQASWAFDRLKLAFNASGRWEDLFDLYDEALGRITEPALSVGLLREAAMAAKDFASDAGRAIGYLERLDAVSPGDSRVEVALERLYDRAGRVEPLIALLERRLAGMDPEERQTQRTRIAGLWLDLGRVMPAFEITQAMLVDGGEAPGAIALLERLVSAPESRDSMPPPSGREKRKKKMASVRDLAAQRLKRHYEAEGRLKDVARMLDIELESADGTAQRADRLLEIATLRAEKLGDVEGAIAAVERLVALQPERDEHRRRLAELTALAGAELRRARFLAGLAGEVTDKGLPAKLLVEAGDTFRAVGAVDDAVACYERALTLEAPKAVLAAAARAADPLLHELDAPGRRCDVLERLAELDADATVRATALGEAARLALGRLVDPARAVRAWRQRLAATPTDREAHDGLVESLEALGDVPALIAALGARAKHGSEAAARADRVRVAELHAARLGDVDAAITAWRDVRDRHGADEASFEALAALLQSAGRARELGELLAGEAERAASGERRTSLLVRLGLVRRGNGEPGPALDAFAAAADWENAIGVAGEVSDADAALTVTEHLLGLASAAWAQGSAGGARAAAWAVDELDARLTDRGRHAEVLALRLRAAALPFERARQRELRRDAALLSADRLGQPDQALASLRELVLEEPADEVSASCLPRLTALLEERGQHADILDLLERQGRARAAAGEAAGAAVSWGRAAVLAEERLGDVERALAAHREAAALGSEGSHEALARLHASRGEHTAAAAALEWLVERAPREALGARALRLAETRLLMGDRPGARAALEGAAQRALDAGAARRRLAELYREDGAWAPLADLLVADAARAPDARARLACLREAARIHLEQRGDSAAAAPLLAQAVEVDPDDSALRLVLAAALVTTGQLTEAQRTLEEQLERYGTRRPKDRALVHHALAGVLLRADHRESAVSELEAATRIDPASPTILATLGRVSFENGDLDRAEKTYRALLLVLRVASPGGPSRAAALLDLSEIAVRRGDTGRAREYVESAFEAALEAPEEARELEATLRGTGRPELLARAIESRLEGARKPEEAARALADLVMLHAEALGGVAPKADALRGRAEKLERELERRGATDDGAWSALGRVFDALGEPEREAGVLERRVSAWQAGTGVRPELAALMRLAEIRLANPATQDAGLKLLELAMAEQLDAPRAIVALTALVDRDPGHTRALELLEQVARRADDGAALLGVLGRRVQREPADVDRLREVVDLASARGEPSAAEAALRAALAPGVPLAPEDAAWARLALARLLVAGGNLAEAIDLKELAAEALDGALSRGVWLEVAEHAAALPDGAARAARALERVLDLDPADSSVWRPLLALLRALGDQGRLVALLDRTLPLVDDPGDRTLLRLEQAELLLQDPAQFERGVDALREILVEDPTHEGAAARLTGLLEASGRHDELCELLGRQLDAAKDREARDAIAALSDRLVTALRAQGREADAVDVARGCLDWVPGHRPALDVLVASAQAAGDVDALSEALFAVLAVADPAEAPALALRLEELRLGVEDGAGALRALRGGVERAPGDVALRDRLLARLEAEEAHAELAAVLGTVFEHDPADHGVLLRLAAALTRAGDAAAALARLGAALEAAPDAVALLRARGELLAGLGREHHAVVDVRRRRELGDATPDELRAMLEQALTRVVATDAWRDLALEAAALADELADLERARALLREVTDAAFDLDALDRLARLETRAERWDAAMAAVELILSAVPDEQCVDLALWMADLGNAAGDPARGRASLDRAFAFDPADARVRDARRRAVEASGDTIALAEVLEADALAARDAPTRHALLHRAASLLLTPEGDPAAAARVLERLQAEQPDSIDTAVLLARAQALAGDPAAALGRLHAVAEAHGGRRLRSLAVVYQELAALELGFGRSAEALQALQRACEMDLRSGPLAMQLARLALELGDEEVAQKAFRSISMMKTAADEQSEGATKEAKAEAHYHLARAARAAGDPRKAKLLLMKALSDNPDLAAARALLAELG